MNEKESQPVRGSADPFPTFAALRASHSELLERDPETEGDERYLSYVEEFFERARTTGAVLSVDEERRASQSILNYWLTVLYRADRKLPNTTLVELNPELKPRIQDERCPYPGVREFDETEGKYFFGRQRTIDYLLARLKEENFLALVGPSGSGKSSLVRAGLLPAIRNIGLGAEEDTGAIQRYFFPLITPGSNPPMNLASMLSQAVDQPDITTQDHYKEIRQGSKHVLNFLADKIGRPSVIVVDQCEELFTLCKDREARRAFINNLLELENSKHRVILCTNIEDFGDDLKRLPNFEKIFERGTALLPRLGASELSDAINKPADLVGFKFKDQTVKDIVQEIGTLPVALPLLQFTLVKLWERRGTHDEYFSGMGGCRSILTESAEDFLRSLEPSERRIVEELFRRMVKFDYKYRVHIMPVQLEAQLEAHAVPVRLQYLGTRLGTPEQVGVMVERLAKAQLIRRGASAIPEDEQVELVHESLIQNWPRMAQWVAEQKRRRRIGASSLLIFSVIAFVLGVVFGVGGFRDFLEKRRAHEQAQQWAGESRKHLNEKRLDTAMLLSLAAYQTDPYEDNLDARGALLSTLLFRPRPKAFLKQGGVGDIAFSPDGRLLAANDNKGNINLWDLGRPPAVSASIQDPLSQGTEIAPLIFSNDGRRLISGGAEEKDGTLLGAVTLWDVVSRQPVKKLSAPDTGRIVAVALSRDDKRLAALGKSRVVVIWDTESGNIFPPLTKPPDEIRSIALSNSGAMLATGDERGNVVLWDVKSGRARKTLETSACVKEQAETENSIASIVFSPDDQMLAVSGTEETVLWSPSTGEQIKRLYTSHGGLGMILSFSEDGGTLAGFEGDRQIYMWDMKILQPIGENLFRPIMPASSLAFSRDGEILATRGEQGITLWDLAADQHPLAGHAGYITDLSFSPNADILASSGNDGAVNLWSGVSGESTDKLLNEEESAAFSLAFSHNGKLLASGLLNGKILLGSLEDHETFRLERIDQHEEETAALLDHSAVAFSSDDKTLISVATRAGDVQLEEWDVVGKNRRDRANRIPLEEGKSVTAIALSPDGKYVALATDKKDVLLWNVGEKRMTAVPGLEQRPEITRSLEFSASGRWLVFGGEDYGAVSRYDIAANKLDTIFVADLSGAISDVAFSPDEKTLAVAVNPIKRGYITRDDAETGAVFLVDVETHRVMGDALRGHRLPISALAFSQRGILATGSQDFTVLLWDVNICDAQKKICSVVNRNFTVEERERHSKGDPHLNACQIKPVERKECPGKR